MIRTGLIGGFLPQSLSGFPAKKINIIAITGTDGKTTSSFLIYQILKAAGKKVAVITTVAAYIGDDQINTGLHVTSPHPRELNQLITKMVAQGYHYLVLEITSHGIYQFRTWGIKPLIAGLTNITHEHLDYHLTYPNYLRTKAELLRAAEVAVINKDDQSFAPLTKLLNPAQTLTYSHKDRLYTKLSPIIKKRFPAAYNQMNARLAVSISQLLQIPNQAIMDGIANFPGVPGRLELVPGKQKFTVYVDFAHTPNAVKSVLSFLRSQIKKQKRGRLIAVLGCPGHRDIDKRPLMGLYASQLAGLAIFTSDDSRTEDIWTIIRQMKEHPDLEYRKVVSIADRRRAMTYALIDQAKAGDIVALLGKGHEQSLAIGKVEIPWSDKVVAQEILGEKSQ